MARREERIRALRKRREQPVIRVCILGLNWCGDDGCKLCPDEYPHERPAPPPDVTPQES